jgi:hypothetical protein
LTEIGHAGHLAVRRAGRWGNWHVSGSEQANKASNELECLQQVAARKASVSAYLLATTRQGRTLGSSIIWFGDMTFRSDMYVLDDTSELNLEAAIRGPIQLAGVLCSTMLCGVPPRASEPIDWLLSGDY